jgi:DNA-binding NarL/FixJ family response regulator
MNQADVPSNCRILVVDNHKILRQGLRFLLEANPEFHVVGDAEGPAALTAATLLQPGVILMNLLLPDVNDGLNLVAQFRQRLPEARLIVLTPSLADPTVVFHLIRLGVAGCVPPDSSDTASLEEAIRKVARGQLSFSESAMLSLVDSIARSAKLPVFSLRDDSDSLSPRERDVLDLVAEGLTNRQIADQLVISESTVRSHLHNILDKLKLENRVQVAAYALRHRSSSQRPSRLIQARSGTA